MLLDTMKMIQLHWGTGRLPTPSDLDELDYLESARRHRISELNYA